MTFFATSSFDGCVCAPENDDQHSVHTILSDPSRGIFPPPDVRPPSTLSAITSIRTFLCSKTY